MTPLKPQWCSECGAALPQHAHAGRPRATCGAACLAARRARVKQEGRRWDEEYLAAQKRRAAKYSSALALTLAEEKAAGVRPRPSDSAVKARIAAQTIDEYFAELRAWQRGGNPIGSTHAAQRRQAR